MARIKTEWLSKYWAENRIPLRTRVFAHLPLIARTLSPRTRRLSNGMGASAALRWLAGLVSGVTGNRSLPRFAARTLVSQSQRRPARAAGPEVVLFPDTFANYFDPEIGLAAIDVLESVGYRVIVPQASMCCGRTYLSKGFVSDAQRLAIETVDLLYPYAERGLPIVGLEPSCILTLRDEFLTLLPGENRAARVASVVSTFEEFVAADHEGLFAAVDWNPVPGDILIHGHCHQNALVGTEPSRSCMALAGNGRVDVIDSGCCGMAGSFGYEKEHQHISRAMAERRLAPAVRDLPEDATVVASGTSCRAQILDTTGRRAMHPAEVLQRAIVSGRPEPGETVS
jgi:Fe-S oxidoreductase